MKNYKSLLYTAALILAAACQDKETVPVTNLTDLEEIIVSIAQTKAMTQDGVNMLWENGDQIGLFVANSSTAEERKRRAVYQASLSKPSAQATFTKIDDLPAGKGNGQYYAAYPAAAIVRWGSQNAMDTQPAARRCYATLPVEQTAVKGGWDKMAGLLAASSPDSHFSFNHVSAYVKFTVADASSDFVRLSIQSTAGEPMAAIETGILYEDNNTLSVAAYNTPTDHVTLSTSNGQAFANGVYYIAFIPGTFAEGFVFTFENEQGYTVTKYVKGSQTVTPGQVASIGTIGNLPFGNKVEADINPLINFEVPLFVSTRVSLMGDDISTYAGYHPEALAGTAYYPAGNVTDVSKQYWYKLLYGKMTDAGLDVNNSRSGSTVVRREESEYAGTDFCARFKEYGLGDPDVILLHGGAYDCQYRMNMYPGEEYEGMTPATLPSNEQFEAVYAAAEAANTWTKLCALEDRYFIQAYVKLLNMIHFKHPEARVVLIIGDSFSKRAQQALLKIADHYGKLYGYMYVNFFGLADNIPKVNGARPNDAGFTYIADMIYEEVGGYID